MRYRIKDYLLQKNDDNQMILTIPIPDSVTTTQQVEEALRLVVDEKHKIVLLSSMQKDNIHDITIDPQVGSFGRAAVITLRGDFQHISDRDECTTTVEVDWGESIQDAIPNDYAKQVMLAEVFCPLEGHINVIGYESNWYVFTGEKESGYDKFVSVGTSQPFYLYYAQWENKIYFTLGDQGYTPSVTKSVSLAELLNSIGNIQEVIDIINGEEWAPAMPEDYAKKGEYDAILSRIEGKVSLTAQDAIDDWNNA